MLHALWSKPGTEKHTDVGSLLTTRARVMSEPGLLSKVISGSMVPTAAGVCIDFHDFFLP